MNSSPFGAAEPGNGDLQGVIVQSSASNLKDYVSASNLEEKARLWIEDARANSGRRRQPRLSRGSVPRWNRGSVRRRRTQFQRSAQFKFSPEGAALVVIDMQEYFLNPKSHAFLPAGKAILPNLAALVSNFRAAKLPVIFTRYAVAEGEDAGAMARWWGDVLRENDPMAPIVPELTPAKGEPVLRKTQYDAFYGTNLEKILRANSVRRLAICGVMTDLCCETTARSGFVRGFDVFFCADATATASEVLHVSALKTLAHGFAEVVSCSELAAAFSPMHLGFRTCTSRRIGSFNGGARTTHKAAENAEALR